MNKSTVTICQPLAALARLLQQILALSEGDRHKLVTEHHWFDPDKLQELGRLLKEEAIPLGDVAGAWIILGEREDVTADEMAGAVRQYREQSEMRMMERALPIRDAWPATGSLEDIVEGMGLIGNSISCNKLVELAAKYPATPESTLLEELATWHETVYRPAGTETIEFGTQIRTVHPNDRRMPPGDLDWTPRPGRGFRGYAATDPTGKKYALVFVGAGHDLVFTADGTYLGLSAPLPKETTVEEDCAWVPETLLHAAVLADFKANLTGK